jgi:hypothetical protein
MKNPLAGIEGYLIDSWIVTRKDGSPTPLVIWLTHVTFVKRMPVSLFHIAIGLGYEPLASKSGMLNECLGPILQALFTGPLGAASYGVGVELRPQRPLANWRDISVGMTCLI